MLSFAIGVLTPLNVLAIFIGVLLGLVVGALPGLTANLGVALLLPITASIDPTAGLLMLLSLYTAAIYGGSFTAVLLHAPGTSASAATAIEGFVLTQRGEANKAIRISTFASVVGGVASGIALLLFAPPLSRLALRFGPAEYFLLAVFGLTIIGSLSAGNLIKGLIAGAAGLFLSTVGMDLESGFPRYTFGSFALQSGISFVPAVIGLFSLSQALLMCETPNRTIQPPVAVADPWRFLPTPGEVREIAVTLLRSSGLGIFIGILPGAGADIGSWVSYNEAKRFARDKSQFGKGSIVGIAASESGNNAVTGSSLIPLLTLGIPGSTTAAILLGALMVHGLQPGQALFVRQAHIIYPTIFGFILANIIMGLVGMTLGRFITRMTRLPNAALIATIFTLSIVGTYSLGNDFADVVTMMAFGLIGYLMRKTGFHPAPLILGLILGPIAETGFRQSVTLADGSLMGYILRSPISVVLAVLILMSVGTAAHFDYRTIREERGSVQP